MAHIYDNITQLIGNTPLIALHNIEKLYNLESHLLIKLESLNPGGSVKDRIAKAMIEGAEKEGLLKKGGTIIESTSGNTGIGLALIAAAKGYRIILTMPDVMSIERRALLKGYGAELILTPGSEGMGGAIAKAQELLASIEGSFMPSQFTNQKNPEAHYNTTAVELYRDTDGDIDAFIAGIGTGGTISGVGKFLKEKNENISIIGVEPTGSPMLTQGKKGPHKIQGIGAGFIPSTLNTAIYDEVITVENEDAIRVAKEIALNEGISVGISSGAALHAAIEVAKRAEFKGKRVVALLPDNGDRYLSTPLFEFDEK